MLSSIACILNRHKIMKWKVMFYSGQTNCSLDIKVKEEGLTTHWYLEIFGKVTAELLENVN